LEMASAAELPSESDDCSRTESFIKPRFYEAFKLILRTLSMRPWILSAAQPADPSADKPDFPSAGLGHCDSRM
jgi:hypothetical protein